jgi:hypothetical protein
MPTLLAAPFYCLAPSRGSHANAESVCLGTPTPIGLVSPLQSSDSLLSSCLESLNTYDNPRLPAKSSCGGAKCLQDFGLRGSEYITEACSAALKGASSFRSFREWPDVFLMEPTAVRRL